MNETFRKLIAPHEFATLEKPDRRRLRRARGISHRQYRRQLLAWRRRT